MRLFLRLLTVLAAALGLATLVCGSSLSDPPPAGTVCDASDDAPAAPKFVDKGDGTIARADPRALRFQKEGASGTRTWEGAREYCDALDLAGLKWRLPARTDLESLIRECLVDRCRMEAPFTGPCGYYWTAEVEKADDADSPAGFTDMGFGGSGFDARDREHHVRCVSDG
ncbi:MAG: DUF1566 domain-containing protein [Deltaproteobacteria bacterium]|nr:DUF1566 domain-containing protein [Deltaproteobacteria bacterium]